MLKLSLLLSSFHQSYQLLKMRVAAPEYLRHKNAMIYSHYFDTKTEIHVCRSHNHEFYIWPQKQFRCVFCIMPGKNRSVKREFISLYLVFLNLNISQMHRFGCHNASPA